MLIADDCGCRAWRSVGVQVLSSACGGAGIQVRPWLMGWRDEVGPGDPRAPFCWLPGPRGVDLESREGGQLSPTCPGGWWWGGVLRPEEATVLPGPQAGGSRCALPHLHLFPGGSSLTPPFLFCEPLGPAPASGSRGGWLASAAATHTGAGEPGPWGHPRGEGVADPAVPAGLLRA